MRITKFVHSCLLAETDEYSVLFDPGEYSYNDGSFHIDELAKLDYVVITHEHPDHFHLPFVKDIIASFPEAKFISTDTVVSVLKENGVKHAGRESDGPIEIFSKKPHADGVDPAQYPPHNIAVHFDGRLTVGGDRHNLEISKEILAFPLVAPWGSIKDAAVMVINLRPMYALPIHDWMLTDQARQKELERFTEMLSREKIEFIKPQIGKALSL